MNNSFYAVVLTDDEDKTIHHFQIYLDHNLIEEKNNIPNAELHLTRQYFIEKGIPVANVEIESPLI
jgi:hypothetical protein